MHCIRLLTLLKFSIFAHGALAADFSGANLRGAHLTNADLGGSNLSGADLTDAILSGTDLRGTNVTQQQLDSACGSGTKLRAGLSIQPCQAPTAFRSDTNEPGQRDVDQAPPEAQEGFLIEAHGDGELGPAQPR